MAVVLHTSCGDLPVLLRFQACPLACFNFLALCASGYYNGCQLYRHFPGILLQTGDPTNSGKGGESVFAQLPQSTVSSSGTDEKEGDSTQKNESDVMASLEAAGVVAGRYFRDEGFGEASHAQRGVLSMAHKGAKPDTNASQFFITTSPQPSFDSVYTAFAVVDLEGTYDSASGSMVDKAMEISGVADANSVPSTTPASGDAVLRALEEAAAEVDAKNFVKNAAHLRINSVTVLYNPFAEGKMRL
jgi:peptidylprolyl isomerase